ncbi:villin/Gelsolin [Artemisia annua]|uniref:Villin/Gelsolin n=1 Tax=Artemisia annua TaxID=35608 RepID=A0A2U1P6V5_ARTAN|nr:villin/Gelsolin [Artemisia annua]
MTTSSTSSDGIWPCPFRRFHCCPDGVVGNKGIARLISHLKRLHLSTDERKCVLREAISTDHGSNDMSGYIVGISNPSNKESETKVTEGLVLDTELLDPIC